MRYQTLCVTTIVIISTSKLQGSHLRLAAHVSWLGERSRASITSTWRSFTGWSDQDVWVWEQDCGTNICIAANLKIQAKTNPYTAMTDLWATTSSIVMMWRFANSTSLDFCRLPLWMAGRPHATRLYTYRVDDEQYRVGLHQVVIEGLSWGVAGAILSPPESRWDRISSVQVNFQNMITVKNCAIRAGNYKLIAGHTRDPHWWDATNLLHWLLIFDNVEIMIYWLSHSQVPRANRRQGGTSLSVSMSNIKNGLLLPTVQWYAPPAVINDAWYCIVLHGVAL